jgi:hypothetical protein
LTAACAVADGTATTNAALTNATVRFIMIPVPSFPMWDADPNTADDSRSAYF